MNMQGLRITWFLARDKPVGKQTIDQEVGEDEYELESQDSQHWLEDNLKKTRTHQKESSSSKTTVFEEDMGNKVNRMI